MRAQLTTAAEPHSLDPLPRDFFARSAPELAPALLGAWVVSETADGLAAVRLVETEAYGGPDDLASHARAGLTRRTAPMFGPPGHGYVYLVYGMHHCLNVVCARDGEAGAVLLRAGEPVAGVELMRARRGRPRDADARLAAGPARLCQALAVDRTMDGHDLTIGRELWLSLPGADEPVRDSEIVVGPRVGVGYAGEWAARPWRFWIRGHPSVSRR
jgi:DNA-3-methyladenine glycosylase